MKNGTICALICVIAFTQIASAIDQSTLSIITNNTTRLEDLKAAMSRLGSTNESPSVWERIATNASFSDDHRRLSLVNLFQRHVRPGMRLFELRNILGDISWLRDSDIRYLQVIRGKVPLNMDNHDAIWSVELLPKGTTNDVTIFQRTTGKFKTDQFVSFLRKANSDPQVGTNILNEIAVSYHTRRGQ